MWTVPARRIKLPPINTMLHNQIPKQEVLGFKGDLMSSRVNPSTYSLEDLEWSTSSSEHSIGKDTSNILNDRNFDRRNNPTSPFNHNETGEERLGRWKRFYGEKPMECYFDKDGCEEYLENLLFDGLYEEVQYAVYEAGPSYHRGHEHVRLFWNDVRRQLRDDDRPVLEWPPAEEPQHCTASMYNDNPLRHFQPHQLPGKHAFSNNRTCSRRPPPRPKSPAAKGTTTGADAELLDIRRWLTKRSRRNLE
jgi:hypothetical protein